MGRKLSGLELKTVDGVDFEYLPVERGVYKGLMFLFVDEYKVTQPQINAVAGLRELGYAVGIVISAEDAKSAMKNYFKGLNGYSAGKYCTGGMGK